MVFSYLKLDFCPLVSIFSLLIIIFMFLLGNLLIRGECMTQIDFGVEPHTFQGWHVIVKRCQLLALIINHNHHWLSLELRCPCLLWSYVFRLYLSSQLGWILLAIRILGGLQPFALRLHLFIIFNMIFFCHFKCIVGCFGAAFTARSAGGPIRGALWCPMPARR